MSKPPALTFAYQQGADADGGWIVTANGKPVKTVAGAPLVLPEGDLAAAIATEMQSQGQHSPLFRLASVLVDKYPAARAADSAEVMSFIDTDLLCYRAHEPADLVAWQSAHWEPHLAWAAMHGIRGLKTTHQATPLVQSAAVHQALEQQLSGLTDASLLVTVMATRLTGSAILGLAFGLGVLDSQTAHTAAHADEFYQIERYAHDEEQAARLNLQLQHLEELQQFRDFLRGD